MNKFRVPGLAVCLALLAFSVPPLVAQRPAGSGPATYDEKMAAWEVRERLEEESLFNGLEWRSVGPVIQGGRVVDIATVPGEPYTFYVAYASGGLWRTTNNGVSFEPIFDDQPTLIMGDIEVDPRNPATVWVGTGENNSSRSSYGGLGIFRSDDRGESWRHVGLSESDRIGRILVDPRDSNRVYVATLGKLYTPGGERGVYRTTDGGESWEQVLAGDEITGFVDLVMDAANPDVLYAAAWERSRRPWDFVDSGSNSGVWKTTDGGDNWTRLTGGFPEGEFVGRIGLTLCDGQPQTIYASVDHWEMLPEDQWDLGGGALTAKRLRGMTKKEFLEQDPEAIEDFIRGNDLETSLDAEKLITMVEEGEITLEEILTELEEASPFLFQSDIRGIEVWRSDDGGATWARTHDEPIRQVVYTYGYYFGEVRVSPTDPERLYLLGVPMITSADGGKTWTTLQDPDVHVDYHAMWIDPNFPNRLFVGNDGGLDVSHDGGKSWLKLDAQPMGQFYAITVDGADPYNIYGGLQDNGSVKGSSKTRWEFGERWSFIGGGDGMYVQVDPRDDATTYAGFQFGFYRRTDPDGKGTQVRPRDGLKEPALRYNWQSPILLSHHNADILYFGTNRFMRSMDQGETWEAISPDLSRSQNRGDVPFGTITTIAESPLRFGLLWAGTDDGYVHVTDDGGTEWTEVTAGLPADRWVSRVEASSHEAEVAYVALNGYRDDDITAYLYRTEDLGRTWTSIAGGLPAEAINVVREDPVNQQVLYVGTDKGVYVSLDRGGSWQGLGSGLPPAAVHDLVVHPRQRELVAGTHGRSAYVLDVLPIQEMAGDLQHKAAVIFPVDNLQFDRGWKGRRSPWFRWPDRDPDMKIPFWVAAGGTATLEILDSEGRKLQKLETEAVKGVSTFTWDLLLDGDLALEAEKSRLAAEELEKQEEKSKKASADDSDEADSKGRLAKKAWAEAVRLDWPLYITPGTYTLKLSAAGETAETELVVDDPEPREPRMKPKPKIRGEKDDKKDDKK